MPYKSIRGTFHICDPKPHLSTGISLEVEVSTMSKNGLLSIMEADSAMEQAYIIPFLVRILNRCKDINDVPKLLTLCLEAIC